MDGGSDEDEEAPCTSLQARAAAQQEEEQEGPSAAPRDPVSSSKAMGAAAGPEQKPKSIHRAKTWSDEVENLYRFQQAGYRDEVEYKRVRQVDAVERWPETGFVKKLQRRDNTFYYYDRERECEDKEVRKVKVFSY